MTLWLILGLLLLVLSPFAWLLPSRGQRGVSDVRLAARRQGVAMQLANQEWPHWLLPPPPRHCAQYYLPRRRGSVEQWCYWQCGAGVWLNRWQEVCAEPGVLAQLSQLPSDVYQVEAGRQVISAFWGESGGEADLFRLKSVLEGLA